MSAPQSGFQRLQAGRTLVLADAGRPPAAGYDRHAHAGTLSFEMSIGRERLIVNCGAHPGDDAWREAQRTTAAHSTMLVGDTNSSELSRDGPLGRRPDMVTCRRDESDGNIWLDASHDGYQPTFGAVHHRRLYLAASGDDLRGEDRLEGSRPCGFTLRFHLHPGVQANLAQSGNAVLLRLPKGDGWRLTARGAALALEPSVYLGVQGETRRSQQIVLQGNHEPAETTIKWALQRETKPKPPR